MVPFTGRGLVPRQLRGLAASAIAPSSANLDWGALGFEIVPVRCRIESRFSDDAGAWSSPEVCFDPDVRLPAASVGLQYGQTAFEGLKAFAPPPHLAAQGIVARVFRPDQNARRFASSAARLAMPPVPTDLFLAAITRAVTENIAYLPPHTSRASMYLRPILFGTSARIRLAPSASYTFTTVASPVGNYFGPARSSDAPSSPATGLSVAIASDHDRAAPRGVGAYKVSSNYAPDLLPSALARSRGGFGALLYLDAAERRWIEEFSGANLVGVRRGGRVLVTPESGAVLRGVTNDALQALARGRGMAVERRRVGVEELGGFEELGAVGTAAVVAEVRSVWSGGEEVWAGEGRRTLAGLREELLAVQFGDVEDRRGWMVPIYAGR